LGGSVGIAKDIGINSENHAVHALIRFANLYPGELRIVAIGPATNLALASALDPRFAKNVKEVIYMGCTSRGVGNTTPHAEFNVACDPEAAHIMLDAFAGKLTIVSWELSCDHSLPWDFYDKLCSYETVPSKFIKRICRSYEEHVRSREIIVGQDGEMPHTQFILCDAYAVAILLNANCIIESKVRK